MTLVGAGYRHELAGLFHGEQPVADCFELVADRYFGDKGFSRPWELRGIAGVPTIVHGLCGNAASVHGPDLAYLRQIRPSQGSDSPISRPWPLFSGRNPGPLWPSISTTWPFWGRAVGCTGCWARTRVR